MSLVPVPNLEEDRHKILERVMLNGVSNENTERAYRRALGKFLAWYDAKAYREISRQVLDEYRAQSVASDGAASSTNLERSAHVPLGVESRIA
jgi:site-specific recombinase XerD